MIPKKTGRKNLIAVAGLLPVAFAGATLYGQSPAGAPVAPCVRGSVFLEVRQPIVRARSLTAALRSPAGAARLMRRRKPRECSSKTPNYRRTAMHCT